MRVRALIVLLTAVVLGLWAWGDLDSVNFWDRPFLVDLGYSTSLQVGLLAALVVVGFFVGRWWVLAALVGPVISLGLAQAAGERGFDGDAPLLSPPGIGRLIFFAACLLLGFGIASIARMWYWREDV